MSVRTFYMDDCTIPVPAGFRDRSIHVLEWRTPEDDAVALVIQRDALPEGPEPEAPPPAGALERYVADQIKEYPAQFAGFRLERDEVATGDAGFEMRRIAFRWRNDQDVLYHHQAFVLVGGKALVLTASSKAVHRPWVDHLIDDALANLQVRGD